LKGRDPEGRVSIQEGKRVLDRLEEELLALVDRNTGLPIVSNVIRAGEAFEGRQSDRFADLFVEWNRDVRFTSASSATIGTVRVKSPSWRTGNHVSGGIFFGRGPLVGSGQSAERNSIIDLAPSIAAILGHDLPDADGRPIAALVGWSSDAREEEPRDRPA
jgi:predicted AlkP superfamily phosphohydrolase/phosphomutase